MYLHYIYWKSGTLFCAICQDIWWKHKVLGFIAVRVRVAHLFICLCVVFRFVIVSCFFVFNSVFCFCLLRSVSCVQCCPWLKNKPFCIAPSVFFLKFIYWSYLYLFLDTGVQHDLHIEWSSCRLTITVVNSGWETATSSEEPVVISCFIAMCVAQY